MAEAKRPEYGYYVTFSEEDKEFVATYIELPELSGLGESIQEAVEQLDVALDAWVEVVEEGDLPPPSEFGAVCVIDRSRFGEEPIVGLKADIVGTVNESAGGPTNLTSRRIDSSAPNAEF